MNPIFLIIGAPAVGKSSTSRALAAHFSKSLHIPVDDLRQMVASGLAHPSAVWNDELKSQVALARGAAVPMALNYHAAGFVPVLDDFWDPHYSTDYTLLIHQAHTHKIILYPSQDVAHQRNSQRSGPGQTRDYIDQGIQIVYQQLSEVVPRLEQEGWKIIDTSTLSVNETVATIVRQFVL
jgi:predicted kinase